MSAPGIRRSIRQGFRAANQSWWGLGFVIGLSAVALVLVAAGIKATHPPKAAWGAFLQVGRIADRGVTAETFFTSPGKDKNLRDQLTEEGQAAVDWLKQAWLMLLICVAGFFAVSIWLKAGMIRYLAKHISAQETRISECWEGAGLLKICGALLMVKGLLTLGLPCVALAFSIASALILSSFKLLDEKGFVSVFLMILVLGGPVWYLLRASFSDIAVVVDQLGPIAGLRASFRNTQGRWLQVFGLHLVALLIYSSVELFILLLSTMTSFLGGFFMWIMRVSMLLVTFYLSLVTQAAFIQFYEDTKTQRKEGEYKNGRKLGGVLTTI